MSCHTVCLSDPSDHSSHLIPFVSPGKYQVLGSAQPSQLVRLLVLESRDRQTPVEKDKAEAGSPAGSRHQLTMITECLTFLKSCKHWLTGSPLGILPKDYRNMENQSCHPKLVLRLIQGVSQRTTLASGDVVANSD